MQPDFGPAPGAVIAQAVMQANSQALSTVSIVLHDKCPFGSKAFTGSFKE